MFTFVRLPSLALLVATSAAANAQDCDNCTACDSSATALAGTHENIISPVCPEGSVAGITTLSTIDDVGDYEIITWNRGATTFTDAFSSPYKYDIATVEEDVECFSLSSDQLPVVGDQTEIKVTLNCERTRCEFRWNIVFDCFETGVLVQDTGGGVQVLSDVDDTIVCPNPQGATDPHRFAGVDTRLEAKELYPGVAELFLAMALGPSSDSASYVPAKPILLSARPREATFLSISQDSELNLYMEQVGDRNFHEWWGTNIDSSLYGTLFDGTSHNEFGETKAKHYSAESAALPNTRFAFFGDNGQGDVCGAQSMLQSANGNRLVAVFIHLTQDPANSLTDCEDPDTGTFTLDLPESETVHYHTTHSEATLWALMQNLISCCSANNVYVAVEEWVACRCDGICEYALPTGVSEQATREETLAYCEDVKADQALLKERLNECDPQGDCPLPETLPNITTLEGSGSSHVFFVSATLGLLVVLTLFVNL